MMRVLQRLQIDRLRSICVKESAQAEFIRWVQSRMKEMVWSDSCSSWCKFSISRPLQPSTTISSEKTIKLILNSSSDKLPNGKVVVPWPGTTLHYYAATEIIRWEDFDLRFSDLEQKYASFGNGITPEAFSPATIPWLEAPSPALLLQNSGEKPAAIKTEPVERKRHWKGMLDMLRTLMPMRAS